MSFRRLVAKVIYNFSKSSFSENKLIKNLEHALVLIEKISENELDYSIDSDEGAVDDTLIITHAKSFGSNMLEDALRESCQISNSAQPIVEKTEIDEKRSTSIFSTKNFVSNVEWLGRTTVDLTNNIIPGIHITSFSKNFFFATYSRKKAFRRIPKAFLLIEKFQKSSRICFKHYQLDNSKHVSWYLIYYSHHGSTV